MQRKLDLRVGKGHHEKLSAEVAAAAIDTAALWSGERAKELLSTIEARASRSHFNGLRCEALAKVMVERGNAIGLTKLISLRLNASLITPLLPAGSNDRAAGMRWWS